MTQNKLPKDWKWVSLSKVVKFHQGYGFPKDLQGNKVGEYPFYKVGDISKNVKAGNRNLVLCDNFIDESVLVKLKAKPYPINTIVFAKIGEGLKLNRRGIIKTSGVVDNNAMGLKAIENLCDDLYLYHFFNTVKLEDYSKATTVPSVRKSEIEEIQFPLPPLQTQQAIVSKIEELFSDLDKGIEDLKTAQQQLTIYRKSVLMDGVTGKLTNNWRNKNPKNETSSSLFQKIQTQIDLNLKEASLKAIQSGKRKPKDQRTNKKTINVEEDLPNLPKNWNYYRLEDITYLVTDGTHFTPKYKQSGVKFLSVKNVRPFYFREDALKYISLDEHNLLIERCKPQKDDILYTKVGATYGYAAKITMDYDFSIFVSLCLIKPVYEFFSSDFLEFLMNSELVFQQARKRVSGTAVPDLHLIEIRDFKIPLPSLEEQNQIVFELETRLSVADKMEESIAQSLLQAEALRQSILKKAFSGELV